jgi:hypothetical protein
MAELNIKSSTFEKGIELAKEFLGKLLGPSLSEQGEIWGDAVKMRRMKNQIDNLSKAQKICAEKNIPLRSINLKFLFPYLEGVAVEENETLQDMWANLLVNYIDSSKNMVTHVFPMILQQLSSDEVNILKAMEEHGNSISVSRKLTRDAFCQVDWLLNLERLGIVKPIQIFRGETASQDQRTRQQIQDNKVEVRQLPARRYIITAFGKQFLEACKR